MSCRHDDTVPVNIRHWDDTTYTVAYLCRTCSKQRPANWGCDDCEWEHFETREMCDPEPTIHTVCTRPCPRHQEEP